MQYHMCTCQEKYKLIVLSLSVVDQIKLFSIGMLPILNHIDNGPPTSNHVCGDCHESHDKSTMTTGS